MNTIGKKIREIRKIKGFSQEELSDLAKINLRTIQRIENNESEPRGKTLSLICEVLNVDIEHLMDFNKREDKSYLIVVHLSVLSFLVIPLGNLIFPLILWISKKNQIVGLKEMGINLLNFQLIWTACTFVTLTTSVLFKLLHIAGSNFLLYIFLYFILLIYP